MNINPDLVTRDTPVGTKEISLLLDVDESTVKYWRSTEHRAFPEAQPTPCHGSLWWRWGDVSDWNTSRRHRDVSAAALTSSSSS
jgi:hypothetical protein